MDVLAHTLWTNALFHFKYHKQRKMRYVAAFFGVAPDLVGFTPLFIYLIVTGRIFAGVSNFNNPNHWTFRFAEQTYNYTHSLIVFAVCFIIVMALGTWVFKKNNGKLWVYWPMLGWALHVLIDIPSHAGHFYLTPFLFPISDVRFTHGVPWDNPVFMAVNYCSLAIIYIGLVIYQKWKYAK